MRETMNYPTQPALSQEEAKKKREKQILEASEKIYERLVKRGLKVFDHRCYIEALRDIAAQFDASPGSDQYLPFCNQVKTKVRNKFSRAKKPSSSAPKKVGIIGPTWGVANDFRKAAANDHD